MSFSQFGYPYNATSQFFMSPKPSTTCCDSISRSVPDPTNAPQTPASSFCYPSSCEKRLVSGTRTELSAALGVYGAPYAPAHAYANYFQYGADSSSIYSSLAPQYEIKEGTANLHSGISQPSAYYTYDHSLGPYQYDRYGTVDLNGSARRKNATRETTSTLKTWLYEHRKNPYPTKGEKIMLAIITKMTLTQVSTWFANARRRLKKENKMTWSPKNKAGDEKVEKAELESGAKESKDLKDEQDLHLSDLDDLEDEQDDCDKLDSDCEKSNQESKPSLPAFSPPRKNCPALPSPSTFPAFPCTMKSVMALVPDYLDPLCSVQQSQRLPPLPATMASISLSDQKPRIWSLARTAAPEIGRAGVKTETVECQQRGASGQSPGSIGHCENTKDLQESPISEDKGYGTAINRGLLLHCSSYQVSTNSCQYSSLEGSCSRGKPGPESSELSDACLMLQEAKTTAFRPVMKR